jgi:hypothetical protein
MMCCLQPLWVVDFTCEIETLYDGAHRGDLLSNMHLHRFEIRGRAHGDICRAHTADRTRFRLVRIPKLSSMMANPARVLPNAVVAASTP